MLQKAFSIPPLPGTRNFPALRKTEVQKVQVNLGRLCNQACRHCHVDASPTRTGRHQNASKALSEQILTWLQRESGLQVLDLTGGAPEMNPNFRPLVAGARGLGRHLMVRHNLTVQFEPDQDDLPRFFAEHGVEVISSLPCYQEENVDQQRGQGVFEKSLEALRRLNAEGYGMENSNLILNLVFNPGGAKLPPPQAALEADYRQQLFQEHGIHFHRLLTLTNQPIHRFREDLERRDQLVEYMDLLEANFNEATLDHLMCRNAVSVRWDGRLFDCDFNLVLDLPMLGPDGRPLELQDLLAQPSESSLFPGMNIAVDRHCFACSAGCGSSCGGALVGDAES
ncbi:MAG: radical SAM/Cys-rich domain protein [Planctomycetota bacterium]|nr:MAG: radical SAM/Cys-rich domain protein [Planctomycetota bacterium]